MYMFCLYVYPCRWVGKRNEVVRLGIPYGILNLMTTLLSFIPISLKPIPSIISLESLKWIILIDNPWVVTLISTFNL